jgi:hypothetical protein
MVDLGWLQGEGRKVKTALPKNLGDNFIVLATGILRVID